MAWCKDNGIRAVILTRVPTAGLSMNRSASNRRMRCGSRSAEGASQPPPIDRIAQRQTLFFAQRDGAIDACGTPQRDVQRQRRYHENHEHGSK